MLSADLGGNFSTGSPDGDNALLFARTWAERLAEELPAAIAASERLVRDSDALERMEDWSPSEEDVDQSFRRMWAANASAVWAGYQAERWLRRLAKELGEPEPEPVAQLHDLRNALEHLDEAIFDDETSTAHAAPTAKPWAALRKLGELPLWSWKPGGPLFALVDVGELRRLSQEITGRLDGLLNEIAEDYMVQEEMDRRLGK